ncbi:hypothetical protein ACWEQL_35935 [Kitasatospora sp. NPDC004240]
MAQGAPGMADVERAIAEYLVAEQALGRVDPVADADSLALAVVGTVHHLLMTSWAGTEDPRERARRFVAALVAGVARNAAG